MCITEEVSNLKKNETVWDMLTKRLSWIYESLVSINNNIEESIFVHSTTGGELEIVNCVILAVIRQVQNIFS